MLLTISFNQNKPARATGLEPWPLRANGLIVFVSPNWSDRKDNNKVSKCKLKKEIFGNIMKESVTLNCATFTTQTIANSKI